MGWQDKKEDVMRGGTCPGGSMHGNPTNIMMPSTTMRGNPSNVCAPQATMSGNPSNICMPSGVPQG